MVVSDRTLPLAITLSTSVMLTAAARRGVALAVLCCSATACDRTPKPANATAAADAPAVVKLPPPILPSDTAKPDTMPAHVEKLNRVRSSTTEGYAVLGAAIVFGDRRMIASLYSPEATLTTPDSTYRGLVAIANALAALGPPKSLRSFDRRSLVTTIVDSMVVDSGAYVAVSGRKGADSTIERGSFLTRWRMHPPPMHWVMTSDRLFLPTKKVKGR